MDITWKGSPNYNKRTKPVKKIVIHWFGLGTLESANTRFQNAANKVSAHYGISKGRIWQWVKEEDVAWHAGDGAVNAESIGIEHDATTDHNLSDQDYKLSGQLVAEIAKRHNILLDRAHIIGHKEVKPTQCPGTIDIDRIISIAMQTTLKVQLVFNNQTYTNETNLMAQAASRMTQLSGGKVVLDFLPPIRTIHQNIPAKVYMDASGQDCAVDKDWFIENVWSLNKGADVVIFVGKPGDWQNTHEGITTYGHYYSELPATFPALMQIVAGENDVSWKWPTLPAFVHYVTHEISHALFQNSDAQDQTHLYDYASVDGLATALPNLNYETINYRLAHKVSYERNAAVFIKKEGDGTIYLNEADVLVPFSAKYENFLADFPNAKVLTLSPNEFLKLRIANKVVIKDR